MRRVPHPIQVTFGTPPQSLLGCRQSVVFERPQLRYVADEIGEVGILNPGDRSFITQIGEDRWTA